MGRVIAVASQKGGTAKTTTTLNIGAVLAQKGERILLIDMDSQANCSSGVGVKVSGKDMSIKDVLLRTTDFVHVVRETPIERLFLAPSHLLLANIEMQLTTTIGGFRRLATALDGIRDEYDHIIIDCPPSLGILCTNGIIACDEVIIPMEAEMYALEGMEAFEEMLDNISVAYGHRPFLLGILITKFRRGTTLHEATLATVRNTWAGKVFDTVIRQNIDVSAASVDELPVVVVNPKCMGAQDYISLTQEVLDREKPRSNGGQGSKKDSQ